MPKDSAFDDQLQALPIDENEEMMNQLLLLRLNSKKYSTVNQSETDPS